MLAWFGVRRSESGLLCMLAYGVGGGGVFKAQRHVSVRWWSIYIHLLCCSQNMRPHYHDSTISRPICEFKHGQVWSVLAWGTSWEVQMLHIFFAFFLGHWFKYHNSALSIKYHISHREKKSKKYAAFSPYFRVWTQHWGYKSPKSRENAISPVTYKGGAP